MNRHIRLGLVTLTLALATGCGDSPNDGSGGEGTTSDGGHGGSGASGGAGEGDGGAGQGGSGAGGQDLPPCTATVDPGDAFDAAFAGLSAGDTLCLNDGVYQQAMDIPSDLNVRAVHDLRDPLEKIT